MPFIEYANDLLIIGEAVHILLKLYIGWKEYQSRNEKSRPA